MMWRGDVCGGEWGRVVERFEGEAIDGGAMYGYGLSLVGSREVVETGGQQHNRCSLVQGALI